MRKIVLAMGLLVAMLAGPMVAEKPKVNPADYTITVHVVGSHYADTGGGLQEYQQLEVVIDGKTLELQSESGSGVLALSDYKAKYSTTGFVPKHPNGYDLFQVYRFLLPDGAIRDFDVIGMGTTSYPGAVNP